MMFHMMSDDVRYVKGKTHVIMFECIYQMPYRSKVSWFKNFMSLSKLALK